MINESEREREQSSRVCSFCKKTEADVGVLVEGAASAGEASVLICARCLDLCAKILSSESPKPEAKIAMAVAVPPPEQIDDAVKNLSDQEFRVIELRYGLATGESYSIEDVARELQITPERVAEIEAGAVAKLKTGRE